MKSPFLGVCGVVMNACSMFANPVGVIDNYFPSYKTSENTSKAKWYVRPVEVVCPDCKGQGILKNLWGGRITCSCCNGEWMVKKCEKCGSTGRIWRWWGGKRHVQIARGGRRRSNLMWQRIAKVLRLSINIM